MNHLLFKRAFWRSFLLSTALRIWTSLIMIAASLIMPGQLRSVFPFVEETAHSLEQGSFNLLFLAPWYRFDTIHYLEIASGGYSYPVLSTWAPAYPFLIFLLSKIGIHPLLAALIISSLACLAAFLIIYLMVSEIYNERTAIRTLIILTIFPTGFFLVAGYTESLFVLFSVGCLWGLLHKHYLPAGILGALATLTRFQGIILVLPALWILWQEGVSLQSNDFLNKLFNIETPIWGVILPPLTFFGWNSWIHYGLSYPWPWETLNQYWAQHTGFPWEGLIGNLTYLVGIRQFETPINGMAQFFDLFLILFAAAALISTRISFNKYSFLSLFSWGSLLLILCKVDNEYLLISVSRYLLSVFPVFLALALWIKNKWAWTTWLLFSLASQVLLILCFYHWIWVA